MRSPTGRSIDYFGSQAWHGYVNQPATSSDSPCREPWSRRDGRRTVCDHRYGRRSAPPAAGRLTGPRLRLRPRCRRRGIGMDRPRRIAGGNPRWVARRDSRSSHARLAEWFNGRHPGRAGGGRAECRPVPVAFGHGTMVAGLVHLVAPTAKIMPLKAFKVGRHLDGVRCGSRDSLRRGPWGARHQHEFQRDGCVARDRTRD